MQTIFEVMGGTYRHEGDYLLPNIEAPESPQIGFWGRQRLQHLCTSESVLYTTMLLDGTLKGKLHYMFVSTSSYMDYGLTQRLTLRQFADNLIALGVEKAYALDGGQTTVIAMNGQLVTSPDFEAERQISDIIYFATALPDGE